jgi:DNA-binding CsgD family transcriptional regulator
VWFPKAGGKHGGSGTGQSYPPRPTSVESAGPGIEQQGNCGPLNISPRTVKQRLRTLFLRAEIRDGRKRVKLAIAILDKEGMQSWCRRERLTPKEIQAAILVWQGVTNREIGKIIGTAEPVIKNHLRSPFDKLGVSSRLELAIYVASHGGRNWPPPRGSDRNSKRSTIWRHAGGWRLIAAVASSRTQ